MMQLYHSHSSPYVRKVMVLLEESGQAASVELIAVMGNPINPGSLPIDQNPLGKIPALLRDDGPALYDSRVICRYLDDRLQTGVYPTAPRLWEVLTLEALGDGILDASVLMRYEVSLRATEHRDVAWLEGQWAKVARALDTLEHSGMEQLTGSINMGQIAVACALGYLDFRHAARGWAAGRPKLAAWWGAMADRPSMKATAPPAA